jgi:hypothetical protein
MAMVAHKPLSSGIRWKICLGVLLVAVVSASVISSISGSDAESAISVSIAVVEKPDTDGVRTRLIQWYDRRSHFHVIVSNVSGKTQRILREDCSEGYFALTFEFTDDSGKKWVSRKKGEFFKNNPVFWILEPGESIVLDVYFGDLKTWEGFPIPDRGLDRTLTMRAIFEIPPGQYSRKVGIWTGRITSAAKKYEFFRAAQAERESKQIP